MRRHQPLPWPFDQHPFTYAEARAAGLGAGRLRGTDLQVPFRGLRHPSAQPLSLAARCAAFQLGMPERAFFNSITAALLMSIPLPHRFASDPRVHVATPSPGRALVTRGVAGHKVQTGVGDVRIWNGLRISSPERTFCELAVILRLGELVAAGDYVVHHRSPLCTARELAGAVERFAGRRGRPRLMHALSLLDPRSESPQESELRVVIVLAGITGFEVNHQIVVEGHRYRGDIVFPLERVVLEYLGDYHRDPAQWRRDVTRASRLREAGWFVFEVTVEDLRNPADFVRRLRRLLAARA